MFDKWESYDKLTAIRQECDKQKREELIDALSEEEVKYFLKAFYNMVHHQ